MNSSQKVNNKKEVNNQIKSKELFKEIQSKYILEKIFDNLDKKISLILIKYNKNIKKRINIDIKDYKDYSELIEIEIKPINNKYGKFINVKNENKNFYHIYFNNDKKKEIKRNYINEKEEIKIIKIIIDHQIKSFEYLFYNCNYIESINFKKFYRNNINNMSYMFSKCQSLKELNLNHFNTNNVTDMNHMFYGCSSLKELNLNNFNTKM